MGYLRIYYANISASIAQHINNEYNENEVIKMSITIKDVAKKAGVSPSTVSRTINNHYSISEETKEKVRKVMDELGYAYDKSHIKKHDIGVVFPRSMVDVYENPFYLEIVRGISYICNKERYSLHVITGADVREMKTSMEIADCEGYIFLDAIIDQAVTDYLRERMIPYIMIGKPPIQSITSISVDTDNIQAGYEAVKYLLGKGHQKIGYIGEKKEAQYSTDRRLGYIQALTEAGYEVKEDYMKNLSSSYSYNPDEILDLLKSDQCPSAFVVCDDIYAVIMTRLINEVGKKIPDDISIVSFNNSIFARFSEPPLTSIDVSPNQLGMEAVVQMIKHIETPTMFATRTIVPFTIRKRQSVKNMNKGDSH